MNTEKDIYADMTESAEDIPTLSPLELAQEDLQNRCAKFVRLVHDWRDIPVADEIGRARVAGMLEMLAEEIENRRREYARKGIKVYVVHNRGGAPIRVDKNCKLEFFQ